METPRVDGLRLAISSQTPLVRFKDEAATVQGPIRLAQMREGEDYKFTTGGVTRMLLPLLRSWLASGAVSKAEWIAMAAGEQAPSVDHEGIRLGFVGMSPEDMVHYAKLKEAMWALLNSFPGSPIPHGAGGIPEESWIAFDAYQARSADALSEAAARMGGVDLLYVHDFQQIGVAEAWTGPPAPKVFHLHTPYPSVLPEAWRDYFVARLERFDEVIVSTRRYAENLRADGLRTPIHVVRPFIDPVEQRPARPEDVAQLRERYHIAAGDRVILNVGRMDPMKGQDRLLRALPSVLQQVPNARLVLVGNGSFSSARNGGLGLSKGARWRASLESLASELGVAERVTFTGHLDDALIPAAYEACAVFALPSTREGFGLAAIEAWRHAKPIIVSDRAGVSELVEEGMNGYVCECTDAEALARCLLDALADPERADAMGIAGYATSDEATLPVGRAALETIFAPLTRKEATRAAP